MQRQARYIIILRYTRMSTEYFYQDADKDIDASPCNAPSSCRYWSHIRLRVNNIRVSSECNIIISVLTDRVVKWQAANPNGHPCPFLNGASDGSPPASLIGRGNFGWFHVALAFGWGGGSDLLGFFFFFAFSLFRFRAGGRITVGIRVWDAAEETARYRSSFIAHGPFTRTLGRQECQTFPVASMNCWPLFVVCCIPFLRSNQPAPMAAVVQYALTRFAGGCMPPDPSPPANQEPEKSYFSSSTHGGPTGTFAPLDTPPVQYRH